MHSVKSTVIMDRWSKSGRRENNLMVHMIPEAYRKSITLPIQTDVYYFEAQTGTVCTWKGIVARRLLEGYTRENFGSGSGYGSIKKRTKWKQEKQIRINRLSDVVIYNGLFEVSCRIFFPHICHHPNIFNSVTYSSIVQSRRSSEEWRKHVTSPTTRSRRRGRSVNIRDFRHDSRVTWYICSRK